jgi:ABC-type uncharacterized transport system substrate-binding protein
VISRITLLRARASSNSAAFTPRLLDHLDYSITWRFEYSISGKWLELLKEIAPGVTRAAVIRDPALTAGGGQLGAIQAVAPSVGMEASPINVRDAGEIERAITAFARSSNGGLVVTGSTLAAVHRDLIITLAARHKLPAVYFARYFALGGGLISYGPDYADQYRRAAGYVDRILKGEKPADLPVQAGAAPIGMLADQNNPNAESDVRSALAAAAALGRELHVVRVAAAADLDAVAAALVQQRVAAVFVAPHANFRIWRQQLLMLLARHALPSSFSSGDFVKAGGLMSYGPDQLDSYREAGLYVGRILKGEKPADLPVMQSTKFEFVLNRECARPDNSPDAAGCRQRSD